MPHDNPSKEALSDLQMIVRTYMEAGRQIEEVEEQVINCANIPDDYKAALWLLAWSYVPEGKQRTTALGYLHVPG